MKLFIKLVTLVFLIIACNKEKRFSKRLIKKEKWEVNYVTIDSEKSDFLGIWSISQDVDIYDSVPNALWTWSSQDASANWQFKDKGKSFILDYKQECLECEGFDLDSLDYFTFNISGKYNVEKHGLTKMIFKSTSTNFYPGKEVKISLIKKE